jgi:lysophospholipase L1-like esterase
MKGRLLALLLGIVASVVLLEGGLRALALVADHFFTRSDGRGDEGGFRILCLGDSHTYGLGVAPEESYPARLEALLGASDDSRPIQVINLGVPGTNSGQLLRRLPSFIDTYDPDLIIVLTGVNDAWNPADMDRDARARTRVSDMLMDLRVVRLLYLTSREGDAAPPADSPHVVLGWRQAGNDGALTDPHSTEGGIVEAWDAGIETIPSHELEYGERTIRFDNLRRAVELGPDAHHEALAANLAEIHRIASQAEIPIVMPMYAAVIGKLYDTANSVIKEMRPKGVLVVRQRPTRDLAAYLERDYDRKELFFPDQHLRPPLYQAFAHHLCDSLVEKRLVPTETCGTRQD